MKYRRKRRSQGVLKAQDQGKLEEAFPEDKDIAFHKMSAVLIEFVKPYLELAPNRAAYEQLIGLAVIAWDIALLDRTERPGAIDRSLEVIQSLAGEWGQDATRLVAELVERKDRDFAYDRRFIAECKAIETEDGYRVTVISMLTLPG